MVLKAFSDEHRKKLSNAHIGTKNQWFGKRGEETPRFGKLAWNKGLKMKDINPNYINSFKGKNHTLEAKLKMSIHGKTLIGNKNPVYNKPKTELIKQKISTALKNRKLSSEHCKNISNGLKGKYIGILSHRFNKPLSIETRKKISISNKNPSIETRQRMSRATKGKNNYYFNKYGSEHPIFGTHLSEESKANMRLKFNTPEEKTKRRLRRLYQIFPKKDTLPERLIQEELTKRNITFAKHVPLIGQPDLFIEPNICIFADGDYVHGNLKLYKYDDITMCGLSVKDKQLKDWEVTLKLTEQNYFVLRFWETDIKKDIKSIGDRIENLIK